MLVAVRNMERIQFGKDQQHMLVLVVRIVLHLQQYIIELDGHWEFLVFTCGMKLLVINMWAELLVD